MFQRHDPESASSSGAPTRRELLLAAPPIAAAGMGLAYPAVANAASAKQKAECLARDSVVKENLKTFHFLDFHVFSDQQWAGLDILTNGDYHLDADLAGRSWFSYPTERMAGISEYDTETTAGWTYPVGTWLNEIVGGWKYHAVVDKLGPRAPLEFAKIWRVGQARTSRPVKMGTISADLAASVLTIKTDAYAEDKQDLMWDIATILNHELRELAAAGCKVIQIEEPAIHSQATYGAPA